MNRPEIRYAASLVSQIPCGLECKAGRTGREVSIGGATIPAAGESLSGTACPMLPVFIIASQPS